MDPVNVHVKQVQVNSTIKLNKRFKDTAVYPPQKKKLTGPDFCY